jgi:hypothetical protein
MFSCRAQSEAKCPQRPQGIQSHVDAAHGYACIDIVSVASLEVVTCIEVHHPRSRVHIEGSTGVDRSTELSDIQVVGAAAIHPALHTSADA